MPKLKYKIKLQLFKGNKKISGIVYTDLEFNSGLKSVRGIDNGFKYLIS